MLKKWIILTELLLIFFDLIMVAGCGRVVGGPTGGIQGNIYAANGNPVGGATVYAASNLGNTTITNNLGYYLLSGVATGTQTIYITKGSWSLNFQATIAEGQTTIAPSKTFEASAAPRMAVIPNPGDYDDIGAIITNLGYTFDAYSLSDLTTNWPAIANHDIIFFNCDAGVNPLATNNTVKSNLQQFVQNGGSLYASDWAFEFVENTFPNSIDFYGDDTNPSAPKIGDSASSVEATIVDPTLQTALGKSTVYINYNLGGWVVVDNPGSGTTTLLRGTVSTTAGTLSNKPLAVQFNSGSGTVIFTTFHNEAQVTTDMRAILQYFIFGL